jgi:O-antigen/teichoic acid export membrane protein
MQSATEHSPATIPATSLPSPRRDAALMLASGVVLRCCGLIFVMVLSRRLSEHDIGVFFFAEALADTLIVIANFSLDTVIFRQVSAQRPAQAPTTFAPLLGFRLVSGPVYLLCLLIISRFETGPLRWLLPLVGFYTLVESFFFSFAGMFIGVGRVGAKAALEVLTELLFTGGFLLAIYRYPSLETLVIASSIRAAMLLIGSLFITRRWIGPLQIRIDWRIVAAGVPFLLMTLLGLLQGRTETMLLGLLSSFSAAAAYQLSMRLNVAAMFIPQAINLALFRHLAAEGLTAVNRQRLGRSLGLLALFGGIIAAVMVLRPDPVARLMFGATAPMVVPVLRALAPVLFLRFMVTGLASTLMALARERHVFRCLLAGTIAGLIADLLLIPRLGAVGAAEGLLVSSLCQLAMMGVSTASLVARARATDATAPADLLLASAI